MSEAKKGHWKWLHVRLREDDYNKIQGKYKVTAYKTISEYIRKVLLDKAVLYSYRNESLDDFMAEVIALRMELNALGNNYNQTVKRLHSLSELGDIKTWLLLNENSKKILLAKVAEIQLKIDQFSDAWLQ